MKLYEEGRAPNPRRVRIFLAEKGITVPRVSIDINKMEHKTPAFTVLNPLQRTPALQLDDGTIIAESIAICRYFEELQPDPPLFGVGALGKALVEMWQRRIEFGLLGTVAAVFRHLHPAMAQMESPQVAEWGEANKPKVVESLRILDTHLANGRFVCGDAFTVADITGLVALDFMKPARIPLPEELEHVRRWHGQVSQRPSARGMTCALRIWAGLPALCLAALALPTAAAEPLSGDQLRAEVTGNTVTGFNTSGVVFSEFHAPDGRILGHNNSEVVDDGCWQIKNDAVCYYYARGTRPGVFCWRFERAGSTGYSIASTESAITGVVRVEPGNPRGHSDGGKPWACEGLTSGLGPAPRPLG